MRKRAEKILAFLPFKKDIVIKKNYGGRLKEFIKKL
jgi:hypothetical protein